MASKSPLVILRRRKDFLRLLRDGHRVKPSSWLLINFAPNNEGILRCGWTLPRKVGPAVARNRLRRWAREYFRALIRKHGNAVGVDVNLVFRNPEANGVARLDYDRFSRTLDRGWAQVRKRL